MPIKIHSILHSSSNQLNRSIANPSILNRATSILNPSSSIPSLPLINRSKTLITRSVSVQSQQNHPSTSSNDPKSASEIYGVTYVPPLKLTRHHTKGADHGLYDGLRIRAGDNIPKSKQRTKRIWKPNLQKSKLWSEVLGQSLQLRVTTAALKTIDKMGGLDRYVLQMSDKRLGAMGIRIRELVVAAMKERVKLSRAFTQPIPKEEEWRIPQWQDSIERIIRFFQISIRSSSDPTGFSRSW